MKRYYGITYLDYEKAERNGISRGLVNGRVYEKGWDIDKAITKKPRKKIDLSIYDEQIRANGLKRKTVVARIYRGWSVEDAVNTPKYTNDEKINKAQKARKRNIEAKKPVKKTGKNIFKELNRMDFERMKSR